MLFKGWPDVDALGGGASPQRFFAEDPYVLRAQWGRVASAIESLQACGTGATASRSTCGSHPGFERVEKKLAALKGFPKALVLNSGFQANIVLCQSICHHSYRLCRIT